MYSVCVRDHFMIAHSFTGEVFGPAQKLHGATYVTDVEFMRSELDADNLVVDIGLATAALKDVLGELNYCNLDELPDFEGRNTTTEFLARVVFKRMVDQIHQQKLGPAAAGIERLRVVLHESHAAWASYENTLDDGAGH